MRTTLLYMLAFVLPLTATAHDAHEAIHDNAFEEELENAGQDILDCLECHFGPRDEQTLYLFKTLRVAAYPVSGAAKLLSKFGDPRGSKRRHQGVDLGARSATPVVSAWDGKVAISGYGGSAGHYVKVVHPNGYSTVYMHLNAKPTVSKGQMVKAGQQLGGVGMSGNARGTTPHLHFEIRTGGGGAVDPWPYIK